MVNNEKNNHLITPKLIKMDTIENNKAIAIFMGGRFREDSPYPYMTHRDVWLPIHGVCRWDSVHSGKGKILQYHKSWDWIMKVVEKIESLGNCQIDISYNWARISYKGEAFNFDSGDIIKTTKIEAVLEVINQFLIFYNENK